jgi:hypothetical protein
MKIVTITIGKLQLFWLFLKCDWLQLHFLERQLPTILETHGDYLIFKALLYPYFKKETWSALKSILVEFKTSG